jgi:isopenicillin N synthase-like dioxygenase
MTVDFTSIPIIDLGEAEDPAIRPRVLEERRHVLLNVGFLYVRNHRVSKKVIQDLVTALAVLFRLNEQEKDEVALCNSPHFLGYSGTGSETTAGRTDGREQFEFATELRDDWVEGQPLAERLKGPNQARCSTSVIGSGCFYRQPAQ